MKQERAVKFISEDKKIVIFADEDTSLGSMHDFLLMAKGGIVERLNKSQKEEEEATKEVKKAAEKPKES